MTTDLAVRNSEQTSALARYGEAGALDILAQRFIQFFDISEKDMNNTSLTQAALKAAQLSIRFGLTPGVHIYIVKRGGKFAAEESLEAWKDAANKHARIERFKYDVQVREMTPDEVRTHTPPSDRYTTEDCGAWARVIRFDLAQEYKAMGMSYDPPWQKGFWRKEAYEKKEWDNNARGYRSTGKWESDTVPNQRTPQDVANRRAHRAALKAVFSLIQLDDLEMARHFTAIDYQMRVATAPLLDAPKAADLYVPQPDDDDLWTGDDDAGQWREVEQPKQKAVTQAPRNGNGNSEPPADSDNPFHGDDPDVISTNTMKKLHAVGTQLYGKQWGTQRPKLVSAITKGEHLSANDLTEAQALKLIAGMNQRIAAQATSVNEPMPMDMAEVEELAH